MRAPHGVTSEPGHLTFESDSQDHNFLFPTSLALCTCSSYVLSNNDFYCLAFYCAFALQIQEGAGSSTMSSEYSEFFEDALHDLGGSEFGLYYGNRYDFGNQKPDESSNITRLGEGHQMVNANDLRPPPLQRARVPPLSSSDQFQPS